MGIKREATVEEAVISARRRKRHRTLELNEIEEELLAVKEKMRSNAEDVALWKRKSDFKPTFSTQETWMLIRDTKSTCNWEKGIWFSQASPKFDFITWLAKLDRLSTIDRVSRWTQGIDETCVLCKNAVETWNHLFYECSYSGQVWEYLVRGILRSEYTNIWSEIVDLISTGRREKNKNGATEEEELESYFQRLSVDLCNKWDILNASLTEFLFTWRAKRACIVPDHVVQPKELDTWWAIALFRGQSALVKLKRSRRELLTVAMLLAGVHSRYQSESHGVDRLEDLRSFMVEGGYVREMIVHHRPRGFVQAEQNDFEMLAKGPVVVAFDVFQATKTNSGRTGTWDKESSVLQRPSVRCVSIRDLRGTAWFCTGKVYK
ncbi:unnamed protein product [Brassica napus]|nr:unnamed protein product [Brassica napus]